MASPPTPPSGSGEQVTGAGRPVPGLDGQLVGEAAPALPAPRGRACSRSRAAAVAAVARMRAARPCSPPSLASAAGVAWGVRRWCGEVSSMVRPFGGLTVRQRDGAGTPYKPCKAPAIRTGGPAAIGAHEVAGFTTKSTWRAHTEVVRVRPDAGAPPCVRRAPERGPWRRGSVRCAGASGSAGVEGVGAEGERGVADEREAAVPEQPGVVVGRAFAPPGVAHHVEVPRGGE